MGLFSSKIKTYVGSTVYNLAGDEDLRPRYLANVIIGSRFSDSKKSMGELLFNAHTSGPGMKQRRFFKWAQNNYFAMPEGQITKIQAVDGAAVKSGLESLISLGPNQYVRVVSAVIDDADVDYWAGDYVNRNYPGLTEEEWSAEYSPVSSTIDVSLPTGTESFAAPADFLWGLERDQERRILFISYNVLDRSSVEKPDPVDPAIPEYWTVVASDANKFLTYRMGSGNVALDALGNSSTPMAEFYPALPLRLHNDTVSDRISSGDMATLKKGYKKLTGQNIDDLIQSIEDNEQIGDIDFAFLVQGISLNVKEKQSKAYLYKFFQELLTQQESTAADFEAFQSTLVDRDQDYSRWGRWENIHEEGNVNEVSSLYEGPPPSAANISRAPTITELKVSAPNQPEFDFRMRWAFIEESTRAGNGTTTDHDPALGKMKVGEYRFQYGDDFTYGKYVPNTDIAQRGEGRFEKFKYVQESLNTVYLTHQHAPYMYRQLKIVGLEHRNYVYQDKAVIIRAKDALLSDEESGFLVPLHYPTLKLMGLYKGTQITTANTFIVFNSYENVKVRWYQRGIFKILLVVVIAAVSIIFPPIAAAGAATGAALGAGVGTMATIVGAVANAVTGMIVSMVVTAGAQKIFGDKLGAIIGTIASFVAMQYSMAYLQTGSFSVDWSALMRVENIMKLTDAVGDSYQAYLQADSADMFAQIGDLETEYADEMKKIQELTKDVLGMTNGSIDPMILTEAGEYFSENSETFLSRTLMTGSDIAELTHAMIEDFTDISLELPKAIA